MQKAIKIALIMILVIAAGLELFGCWGRYTAAGRKEYPELSALIPYFAQVGAAILFALFLLLAAIRHFYLRRKKAL
jgi:TRAP-type C4-dicarboxylate transport system permease small subunit